MNLNEIKIIKVPFPSSKWGFPVLSGFANTRSSFLLRKRFLILDKEFGLWIFKNDKTRNPQNQKSVVVNDMRFCYIQNRSDPCFGIKIERFPRPFVFYFQEKKDLLRWSKMLSILGGVRSTVDFMTTNKKKTNIQRNDKVPLISQVDVGKWTKSMIQSWLNIERFSQDIFFSIYSQNLDVKKGSDLVKLTEHELMALGITKFAHRKKMKLAIKRIRKHRIFQYGSYVVRTKIYKAISNTKQKLNLFDVDRYARILSDPSLLQQTYLSPHNWDISSGLKSLNDTIPLLESHESNMTDIEDKDFSIRQIEGLYNKEKIKIPVKVFITEFHPTKESKTFREKLSPLLDDYVVKHTKNHFPFQFTLLVGDFFFEFSEELNLCVPRTLRPPMTFISSRTRINTIIKNHTMEEICIKLASVVCNWNTTKFLNQPDDLFKELDHFKNKGRCTYEFLMDLLDTFKIKLEEGESFFQFADSVREFSDLDSLVFVTTKEFRDHFKIKDEKITFKNHKELDEFVIEMSKIDEIGFHIDFRYDRFLLCLFDRIFWWRHFKYPNIEMYKKNGHRCPFDDPRKRNVGYHY